MMERNLLFVKTGMGLIFILMFQQAFLYSQTQRLERTLVEPLVDSPGKSVGADFNGDGISDIAMTAFKNDDGPGANNAGAVYILYGSGALSATYQLNGAGVNVTILGKAATDNLGREPAVAGDINSDGFDDLVIGAFYNDDGGGANAGAAYILYGSPNLSATINLNGAGADATILGKAASDFLGIGTAAAGDVNGDGFDDVLMGAHGNDDTANLAGSAYILYGAATLSQTYNINGAGVNVTLLGKAASDRFGAYMGGLGDVNRDGFDDVIVGAFGNIDGSGTINTGAAYILFGSTTLAATIGMNAAGANVTVLGKAATDLLGASVSGAGDINGDGFNDIIVGAYGNDDLAAGAGAAYVIYGRSSLGNNTIDTGDSAEDVSLLGRVAADEFGRGVSAAGDVNDDGLHDCIICARFNDDGVGGNNNGACYVFYGSSSLAASINAGNSDVSLLGKAALDEMGRRVAAGGDVNNDGFPDLLLGARYNDDGPGIANAGAVYVVFGSETISSTINMSGLGPSVTILGKAGYDDLGSAMVLSRGHLGP